MNGIITVMFLFGLAAEKVLMPWLIRLSYMLAGLSLISNPF